MVEKHLLVSKQYRGFPPLIYRHTHILIYIYIYIYASTHKEIIKGRKGKLETVETTQIQLSYSVFAFRILIYIYIYIYFGETYDTSLSSNQDTIFF